MQRTLDRDMDGDSTVTGGGVVRTVSMPLTAASIMGLKHGESMADGHIPLGHGRLRARARKRGKGVIREFVFRFKSPATDKPAQMTLGPFVQKVDGIGLTLAQARELAKKYCADVRSGRDPVLAKEAERQASIAEQLRQLEQKRDALEKTLEALMESYAQTLENKGKHVSARDVRNIVFNHLVSPFPGLARKEAAAVTSQEISDVLVRLVRPADGRAKGRTAIKLRSFFNAAYAHAVSASLDPMASQTARGFKIPTNPVAAVPVTGMAAMFQRPGTRSLSAMELKHYLDRVERLPSEAQKLGLQIAIMLGGQRYEQLLRLRVTDLRDDVVTLLDPKGRRAQPRLHVLPVIGPVRPLLNRLIEMNPISDRNPEGYLFASQTKKILNAETLSSAVKGISDNMVKERLSVIPFSGRDIRRTCETLMAEHLRISKDDRAQVLSHGIGGVQDKVYDKSQHLEAKREVLTKWNGFIAQVRSGIFGSSLTNLDKEVTAA